MQNTQRAEKYVKYKKKTEALRIFAGSTPSTISNKDVKLRKNY